MYKFDEIKPRFYNRKHCKPSVSGEYWTINKCGYVVKLLWDNSSTTNLWNEWVRWFVDVPDAPKSLMPLKLSKSSPKEKGQYLCYNEFFGAWRVYWLSPEENSGTLSDFLWFIDYPIDKLEMD